MPITIDDFEIPAALLSELGKIVDQAKAGPLLALAKLDPALGRGLRLTTANSKFVRQRLAARLLESGPGLAEWSAQASLLSVMSLIVSSRTDSARDLAEIALEPHHDLVQLPIGRKRGARVEPGQVFASFLSPEILEHFLKYVVFHGIPKERFASRIFSKAGEI